MPTHAEGLTALRIDGGRLLSRLEELAKRGARDDGGCNRLAFTDADKEGRDLVAGWMRKLSLGKARACRRERIWECKAREWSLGSIAFGQAYWGAKHVARDVLESLTFARRDTNGIIDVETAPSPRQQELDALVAQKVLFLQ